MNNYMGKSGGSSSFLADDPADQRRLSGFPAQLYEWLEAIAFALAIVVLLFTFVVRIVSVEGVSMQDTLIEDDRVLVFSMFYTPEQNDIVIILPDEDNPEAIDNLNKPLVKRVVATEGQYLDIRDGLVYVANDPDALQSVEPFDCLSPVANDAETFPGNAYTYPIEIEQGYVFVMGDNRGSSTDSRDSRVGMIKVDNILGKVFFRIFPFNDSFGTIE